MRRVAYVRRGARAGICVLALGVTAASAQEPAAANPADQTQQSAPAKTESDGVKPAQQSGTQATPPTAAEGTSNLPELVVNDDGKKKKKVVKAKTPAPITTTTTGQAEQAETPPSVTLGTGAAADTGATVFDANAINARSNGNGDANTFMRNLPNVQYQNEASRDGGANSQKLIDTKPQLLSISGGRTYENNFILNGVSITNITGPNERSSGLADTTVTPGANTVYGLSPQTIYVPTEFVGEATVIDSNASSEYGQFQGGVVLYDLAAPPTDRYRASVSYSRDTSDTANWVLGTLNGQNPYKRVTPSYEKTTLSASLGAPITNDFAIIGQVSRKEAESSKQKNLAVGNQMGAEDSDNIFYRFAATAKTDIGKFTLDSSRTDYFQHWESSAGRSIFLDTATEGTSTKLEHEAQLAGLRIDAIGLGGVKLKSRAFYNTSLTKNESDGNVMFSRAMGHLRYAEATGYFWTYQLPTLWRDRCRGISTSDFPSLPTISPTTGNVTCMEGGYGNKLQGQDDFGVQMNATGDLLLGSFKLGTELKQYEGRRARLEEHTQATSALSIADGKVWSSGGTVSSNVLPTGGTFDCNSSDPLAYAYLCSPYQIYSGYSKIPKYDTNVTLNALHSYAEFDQTWTYFNVRAGARLDYDDYFENINVAPRVVGTIKPFDGLAITGGVNRYYLGEVLYYALRDKEPGSQSFNRTYSSAGVLSKFSPRTPSTYLYKTSDLATPFDNEYTGGLNVRDPLFDGQWRLRYLKRIGNDQFATTSCGSSCYVANNEGKTTYQSASAEYTKAWINLRNPFNLNAAVFTGNVTWSEQTKSQNSYLYADKDGDGLEDSLISYKGQIMSPSEFNALTGNFDIPVRFGATLSTVWFDDLLELNVTAGVNLSYSGAYYKNSDFVDITYVDFYEDKVFQPSLKLDIGGQINVTEQAAIQFNINNITNSAQNVVSTYDNPWVLGRSYWLGTALRF